MSRTAFKYQPKKRFDEGLSEHLKQLALSYPKEGYRLLCYRLRGQGFPCNLKKIYRIYKEHNLDLRRKKKKRLPERVCRPLRVPEQPNSVWSIDFVSHSLYSGTAFRALTVIDDFSREALDVEVSFSLPALKVIRFLDQLINWRGKPDAIRVDNGPEFISKAFQNWAEKREIEILFIQPGKPTQNAFIERFNGTYRQNVLSLYEVKTLQEVRETTDEWLIDYNYYRPHSALNYSSPKAFLMKNTPLKTPYHTGTNFWG